MLTFEYIYPTIPKAVLTIDLYRKTVLTIVLEGQGIYIYIICNVTVIFIYVTTTHVERLYNPKFDASTVYAVVPGGLE